MVVHRFLLIATLVLPIQSSSMLAAEGVEQLLLIPSTADNPRNGEGDMVELKDGLLAFVYTRFVRGGSDHSPADLALRISEDGGNTWSDDRILVPNESGRNVMSVSLLREKASGEILVFYLRKNDPDNDCLLYARRSSDELQTVGEPICATPIKGYQVVNNDRVIQLQSGRLPVAAAHHTNAAGKFTGKGVPVAYFSDDGGRTWKAGKPLFEIGSLPEKTYQEPGLVELKDGRVWMFMRTPHGFQYGCTSHDRGETFTVPEPIEALASPNGPATIERIPWTGDLLCIWVDHTGWHNSPRSQQRTPLALKISKDEGKTWTKSRVLEGDPKGSFCYTSMTFIGDRVLLSYYVPGGLKVVALTKEWVLRDPPIC